MLPLFLTGRGGEGTGGGGREGPTQQDHGEGEGPPLSVFVGEKCHDLCLQEIDFHREKASELSRVIETLKGDIR